MSLRNRPLAMLDHLRGSDSWAGIERRMLAARPAETSGRARGVMDNLKKGSWLAAESIEWLAEAFEGEEGRPLDPGVFYMALPPEEAAP